MLARAKRDYYAVLGVPPDADRDAIRRAYRARAAEYHPDVSTAPDSAERFRELAEAWEVLSRPESRARYDRRTPVRRAAAPRHGGRPAGGSGLRVRHFDVRASRPRPDARGADIVVDAHLEFAEALRGATRGLRYTYLGTCESCGGWGASADGESRRCPRCGGEGELPGFGGTRSRRTTCPRCGGAGRLVTRPCAACNGRGRVERDRFLLIQIPAGVGAEQEVRLYGEGHAGGPRALPGDVVVTVSVGAAPERRIVRRLAAAGAGVAVLLAVVTLLAH